MSFDGLLYSAHPGRIFLAFLNYLGNEETLIIDVGGQSEFFEFIASVFKCLMNRHVTKSLFSSRRGAVINFLANYRTVFVIELCCSVEKYR